MTDANARIEAGARAVLLELHPDVKPETVFGRKPEDEPHPLSVICRRLAKAAIEAGP